MAWGDRFYKRAKEQVEVRVGESVELITTAARGGAMGAVVAGELARGIDAAGPNPIGLGGAVPRGRMTAPGGGNGERLPTSFLIALTPTAVRVFKLRRGWTGPKVKKELGVVPREGIRLSIAEGRVAKQFQLDGSDRSGIAFEMTRCKFTTRFADELREALDAPS